MPAVWAAVAGGAIAGGGSLLGGLFSSSGSKAQADAIRDSANIARTTALDLDAKARGDLAPFRQYGIEAGNSLLGLLNGSTDVSQYLQASPLFNWQSEMGTRNLNRELSARGLYGSGAGLETLARFNTQLVGEEGSRLYDRLYNLTTLGANASARMATNTVQTGNNVAGIQATAGAQAGQATANQYGAIGQGFSGSLAQVGQGIAYAPLYNKYFGGGGVDPAGAQQEALGRGIVQGTLASYNAGTFSGT